MSSANATSDAPLPVVPHKEPLRWLIAMRVVLFGLVKAGNTLLGILGNPPLSDNAKAFLSRRFGTDRIALIVARVNRALALAGALQVRLFDRIAAIERASVTRAARGTVRAAPTERAAKARTPRAPKAPPEWDDASLLLGMPSDEEIAEMVRRKPPEQVILDICRDLGIGPGASGWDELQVLLTVPPKVLAARARRFARVPTGDASPDGVGAEVSAFGTGPPGMAMAA